MYLFSESLLAIIEIFRIALENCGNKDVKIVSAGTLQRRKSKVPALDVPKVLNRKNISLHADLFASSFLYSF